MPTPKPNEPIPAPEPDIIRPPAAQEMPRRTRPPDCRSQVQTSCPRPAQATFRPRLPRKCPRRSLAELVPGQRLRDRHRTAQRFGGQRRPAPPQSCQ